MKFILEIWPDRDEEQTPRELLAHAIQSGASDPFLRWDIYDDDDTPIAMGIRLAVTEEGK